MFSFTLLLKFKRPARNLDRKSNNIRICIEKNQQLDWYIIILYGIINSVMHSMNIFMKRLYKQTPYCAPI